MAAVNGKRKRDDSSLPPKRTKKHAPEATRGSGQREKLARQPHAAQSLHQATSTLSMAAGSAAADTPPDANAPLHVQIVTGSYERVLHGISARIPRARLVQKPPTEPPPDRSLTNGLTSAETGTPQPTLDVSFSDTFLFAAHASAIRCLAVSPPTDESDKRFLATGSSDERINLYSLSTAPPPTNAKPHAPSLTGVATAENPRNRSLGSLIHHDRAITKLSFPTKTKLFSAAEDATIAISRTRDWTVLSSIKAPIPKPQGRPSGDTAGPGEIPAGVNDFAIHPSQKLMLSVGRGEKCMRLWNLMTGKKAGVLNFDRELLAQVGEGKFASGEGRRVLWDAAGENFVVGFERGAVVFGIDSQPKAIVRPTPSSKVHQLRFLPSSSADMSVLALSTEDGRVAFFDLNSISSSDQKGALPSPACIAELGGRLAAVTGRIKDFEILTPPSPSNGLEDPDGYIFVTASSDGAIRIWSLQADELAPNHEKSPAQIGTLIATQETGERITCLGAFLLEGHVSGTEEAGEEVFQGFDGEDVEDEDPDDSGE